VFVAAATILHVGRHGFFHVDDWDMVLNKRDLSPSTVLGAHGEHLVATQVVLFELLRKVAGWDYAAYRVATLALHLTVVGMVFAFARRRVGAWGALAMAILLMFLGAGGEDLMWAGVTGINLSLATGIGALLVLERMEGRGREVAVCALLLASVASFTYGLAFAIAALVWIVSSPDRRRSSWVAAVPLVAYALWKVGFLWGSPLTSASLTKTPQFVAESAGAAVGAITGLGLEWGRWGAFAAAVAIAYTLMNRRRGDVFSYAVVSLPVVVWVLTGIGRAANGPTSEALHVYAGVVTVMLVAAQLLSGVRLGSRPGVVATIGVVLLGGLLYNLGRLGDEARYLRDQAGLARAYVGAIEAAHPVVSPQFGPSSFPDPAAVKVVIGFHFKTASLDKATRLVGEDPVPLRALERLRPQFRSTVDSVLVNALRIKLVPATRTTALRSCATVGAADSKREFALLFQGRVVIRTGLQPATVYMRRYANAPAATLVGAVPPNQSQAVTVPKDRSTVAWYARVVTPGRTRVCRA
jgi:hypothetical protein